jgi:hypothetical protein
MAGIVVVSPYRATTGGLFLAVGLFPRNGPLLATQFPPGARYGSRTACGAQTGPFFPEAEN